MNLFTNVEICVYDSEMSICGFYGRHNLVLTMNYRELFVNNLFTIKIYKYLSINNFDVWRQYFKMAAEIFF